jgi:GntR family transcriptional regulator, transcriptional repressor for pyruvate dehydrogenase complex
LSERAAQALLTEITSGLLRPGDALPSTRELSEQFGVSRTVIREALRELSTRGVVELRRGVGPRVARPSQSAVRETMSLFLRVGRSVEYDKLTEMREILEVEIAALAAERATPEDHAEMREACEAMVVLLDDVPRAAEADLEFHRAIARSTQNEILLVVLDSVTEDLLELRRRSLAVPGQPKRTVRSHRKLLAAIESGEPAKARAAMREHLGDSGIDWKTLEPRRTSRQ